jgi:ABC-type multidrug transport system permease subunit
VPKMNIINEIKKDWNQFMREGRTLLLMLIAPLMVIVILNLVFSGTDIELQKTSLGFCDLDNSTSSQLFISGIYNYTDIIDYSLEKNCTNTLYNDVKQGKLIAAFIIPEHFEKGILNGETQNIEIYLDNSKFQVSPSIESFVGSTVQKTGREIGTQFILEVWARLNDADSNLETLIDDAKITREKSIEMKENLKQTAESFNSLNIDEVKNELELANKTLDVAYESLNTTEQNLTKIEEDFAEYDETLNQTENDLVEVNKTLSETLVHITKMKQGINCSEIIFHVYCVAIDRLNETVYSAHNSVEDRLIKVREAREGLYEANQTIQDFKENIAHAKNSSEEAREKINNMNNFIYQLEENKENALITINQIDESLDLIIEKTYELEDIIHESREQIFEITSKEPEFVIAPIKLNSHELLGKRAFFDFLLPSMLPLVLMFVALFLASTSLVKEKYNGTFARIRLAQINSFEFISYKVISYTVVMLPSVVLLLLLSSLVYGAFPLLDLDLFVYLVQALTLNVFVFVSLGVLIALYSESEATAFLTSLVIGLPLLFMSGLLFPFEFMPVQVASIGIASPLTQSMLAMQSGIIYNSPLSEFLTTLTIYGIIITLIASLILIRKK